ncbi:MAG: Ig-like domain-containing protein [Ferruginibacter sp.]
MKSTTTFYIFLILTAFIGFSLLTGGCAQIGMPIGGPKDTLSPKLIKANPQDGIRNVATNKITLEFNEYIDVQDLQQNLIISPLQNRNPSVIANPKSITLKFRDTLLPNTTYTINFGDAVRDINENNVYKGLTYTFSTGNTIDSLSLSGKALLAETGLADTTMLVMLYRNATDSTVQKKKPSYISRVQRDGNFSFNNLPAVPFRIYALKDGDAGKTYNSLSEPFGFRNEEVLPGKDDDIILYAYSQEKAIDNRTTVPVKGIVDKRLRYTVTVQQKQSLIDPLEIDFNNPLKEADSNKIFITDTLFRKVTGTKFSLDSTAKKIFIRSAWKPDEALVLIVQKDAVKDSSGTALTRTDTIRFVTKKTEDYGKLTLRFNGIDIKRNPVLQFLLGPILKFSYPLVSTEWTNSMFPPGDYTVRILYDRDKNGVFTPGNYLKKQQPEIAVTLPQTLNVRSDWDNERDVDL